jgi:hypothetical protein
MGNRIHSISLWIFKAALGLFVVDFWVVGEIHYQGEELGFWVGVRGI